MSLVDGSMLEKTKSTSGGFLPLCIIVTSNPSLLRK